MTNHLFWHIATYNPSGEFVKPPQQQLIAVAGIEVTGADPQNARAWIAMSKNPRKLVERLDTAIGEAHLITSFAGTNFGLPVVVSNALRTSAEIGTIMQKVGEELIGHIDMAQELQTMTNPSGFIGFADMSELCDLPARPELNVAEAWESADPKIRKRIGKRLLMDVVLIALGYAQLQYVSEVWNADQWQVFHDMVITAASEKVSAIATVFPLADVAEDEDDEDDT